MANAWSVHRLSTQWVGPIAVSHHGVEVADWTVAVLPNGAQPADVTDIAGVPTSIGGVLGVLVGPGTPWVLPPGSYRVWVRFDQPPEAPVLNDMGLITIT